MSHVDLTVYSGRTHQADRRLSDESQCAFTAMLSNVQTPAVLSQWTPDTVDDWDINRRRCHKCENLWRWHHSRYRNTVADVFTRSSTMACDDLLIQPKQINICPLRVRDKMFIHVSFNVIAVVYNTVIVAKSHVFFSICHTILHIFKSLLRRYLIVICLEPCAM